MRALLIDIGGTSIGAFLVSREERKLVTLGEVLSPKSGLEERVTALAKSICNMNVVNEIIIGIPGDVSGCGDNVFCPPLNRSLSKKSLEKSLSNVVIVNDTKVGALRACVDLSPIQRSSGTIAIVTLGTSIGLCTGPGSFIETLDINELTSHEFAHNRISNADKSGFYSECLGYVPDYRERFFSIYSAGAFGRFLRLRTTGTKGEMIRIEKDDLSRGLAYETDLVQKTSSYMSAMFCDVEEYLESIYGSGDYSFVVLGGLATALREAGFDFSLLDGYVDRVHSG